MAMLKNAKKYVTKKPLMALVLVGVAYYLYNRAVPSLAPSAPTARTSIAPSARYAYDAYPPVRNEPYYDAMTVFGPADGDPVFYGF